MADLIKEYSRDTLWQLKLEKVQIVYLDEFIEESEETVCNLTADPRDKPLEQVYIHSETLSSVRKALSALPERERSYINYRFGFEDEESHSLAKTAEHFHLTVSRARKLESSALKLLKHAILIVIPKRRFNRSTRKLAKRLDKRRLLRRVELRIKQKRNEAKKQSSQSVNIRRTAMEAGVNLPIILRTVPLTSGVWPDGIPRFIIGLSGRPLHIFVYISRIACLTN